MDPLESILAMKDVGIQVRTVYWGGRTVSRFIDRRKIHDIVINEGITMWQIKSYMAIIVKNQEHTIVVFEVSWMLKARATKEILMYNNDFLLGMDDPVA